MHLYLRSDPKVDREVLDTVRTTFARAQTIDTSAL